MSWNDFSLQVFITVPVCVNYVSHNLYICDLKSVQSRDLLHYKPMEYGKMKCVLLQVNESKPPSSLRIMSDYLICNDPGGIY